MKAKLYITRWTDRPLHRYYLDTLGKIPDYADNGIEVSIAYHGRAPLADAEKIWQDAGVRFVESKESSEEFNNTEIFVAAMKDALLDPQATTVGNLDDDARFLDIPKLAEKISLMESNGFGAYGPCGNYRILHKHDNVELPWWNLTGHYTTMGCQMYSADYMRFLLPGYGERIKSCKTAYDAFCHAVGESLGWKRAEFHCRFQHKASRSTAGSVDDNWYLRAVLKLGAAYSIITGTIMELQGPYMQFTLKNFREKTRLWVPYLNETAGLKLVTNIDECVALYKESLKYERREK